MCALSVSCSHSIWLFPTVSFSFNLTLFHSLTTTKSLFHSFTHTPPISYTQICKELSVPPPNSLIFTLAVAAPTHGLPPCHFSLAAFLPTLIFHQKLIVLDSPLTLNTSVCVWWMCVTFLSLFLSWQIMLAAKSFKFPFYFAHFKFFWLKPQERKGKLRMECSLETMF